MSTTATPVHDLLDELARADIRIEAHGDRLHIDAPTGAITPELTDRLRSAKADIIAPGDLPMLDDFLHVFPSAQVIEVVTEDHGGKAASPARQAEAIIEAARERGDAPDLRDAWNERLAICTVSGGLPENDAQVIGLAELRGEA